jgi:hypothetical protein
MWQYYRKFKKVKILGKKINLCVYGHPIDPIFQPPTLTFFIGNYSTLIFASDPVNFYTEFGDNHFCCLISRNVYNFTLRLESTQANIYMRTSKEAFNNMPNNDYKVKQNLEINTQVTRYTDIFFLPNVLKNIMDNFDNA